MQRKRTSILWTLLNLLVSLTMILALPGSAFAQVYTDQADYAPGSVVTISGDVNYMQPNQPAYVDGQPVYVEVVGPNGWTSHCDTTVAAGVWSCQVTLSSDPAIAVG